MLDQLERLETEAGGPRTRRQRHELLEELRTASPSAPALTLALVGCMPPPAQLGPLFAELLGCPAGLRLQWGHPLPATSGDWRWPDAFQRCDVLLYHLQAAAAGRRPALAGSRSRRACRCGCCSRRTPARIGNGLMEELHCQWPAGQAIAPCSGQESRSQLADSLAPLAAWLEAAEPGTAGRHRAALPGGAAPPLAGGSGRASAARSGCGLQQRSQWIVAAAVFAAPLPSLDLLLLGVVNGLMLKEMARLWDCPWNLERLRVAALELARASLAMGVVEWSSQALAGAAKLHGATWLVGGALQALSAAYLTRVVGHAMADMLALSAGVAEPDLETIKRQAPLLIARAAEAEKIDWAAFLHQGRGWLRPAAGESHPRL